MMSGPKQAAFHHHDLVGRVLPDVSVLGALPGPSTDDDVSPLDERRVVLVHWCR